MICDIRPKVKEWYILFQTGQEVIVRAAHCWEDDNAYWFNDGPSSEDPYLRVQKAWTMLVTDSENDRVALLGGAEQDED